MYLHVVHWILYVVQRPVAPIQLLLHIAELHFYLYSTGYTKYQQSYFLSNVLETDGAFLKVIVTLSDVVDVMSVLMFFICFCDEESQPCVDNTPE